MSNPEDYRDAWSGPTPAGRELDAAIAEVMGYRVRRGTSVCDGRVMPWMVWDGPGGTVNPVPYSTDLNAMAAVEAVLHERGLLTPYTDAVRDLYVGRDEPGSIAEGLLLTAPAAVRALAAYRVIIAAAEAK
jgi:hypothetical protein